MILVNVKSYKEMIITAEYTGTNKEIKEDWFNEYGTKTVVYLNEIPGDFQYSDIVFHDLTNEYKNEPILSFQEFKEQYLDTKTDNVNSPSHYNKYSFEVVDVIDEVVPNFPSTISGHLQNTIKYIFRAPFKGNMKQDLEKSAWYLNHAIKILEKNEKNRRFS